MLEKLYASRVEKRAITILDVPEKFRDAVMVLLSESERTRQTRIAAERTVV